MNPKPTPNRLQSCFDFLIVMLASCFFLSYVPAKLIGFIKKSIKGQTLSERRWTGAGLIGSLFGAGLFLLIPPMGLLPWIWILVGGILISVFVSHQAEKALNSHDDSRIVIDEWIGVWVAFFGLAPEIGAPLVTAFILFRFFDVIKGPWGHALQKLPGGWGVTMDDVGAGLLANLVTRFLFHFIR